MMASGSRQVGAAPARSLGRWLVMRYPAAWRERYGDEMLALLDDAHVRWMDVLDLARGLVVERARALIEPGQRPFVTLALVAIAVYLTGLSLTLAAYGLGQVVHLVAEPSSTRVAGMVPGEPAVVDVVTVMGSAVVLVPRDWVVEIQRVTPQLAIGLLIMVVGGDVVSGAAADSVPGGGAALLADGGIP